jgi:hypothetical protein
MASKRDTEGTVQVVGAVAALGVAFVVGSAVVLMTSIKLGPSVEDTSMDKWKHCLGRSDEDQAGS